MQYEIVVSTRATSAGMLEVGNSYYGTGSDETLESKVSQMIQSGWKPLGGVSMAATQQGSDNQAYLLFSQAMIKE